MVSSSPHVIALIGSLVALLLVWYGLNRGTALHQIGGAPDQTILTAWVTALKAGAPDEVIALAQSGDTTFSACQLDTATGSAGIPSDYSSVLLTPGCGTRTAFGGPNFIWYVRWNSSRFVARTLDDSSSNVTTEGSEGASDAAGLEDVLQAMVRHWRTLSLSLIGLNANNIQVFILRNGIWHRQKDSLGAVLSGASAVPVTTDPPGSTPRPLTATTDILWLWENLVSPVDPTITPNAAGLTPGNRIIITNEHPTFINCGYGEIPSNETNPNLYVISTSCDYVTRDANDSSYCTGRPATPIALAETIRDRADKIQKRYGGTDFTTWIFFKYANRCNYPWNPDYGTSPENNALGYIRTVNQVLYSNDEIPFVDSTVPTAPNPTPSPDETSTPSSSNKTSTPSSRNNTTKTTTTAAPNAIPDELFWGGIISCVVLLLLGMGGVVLMATQSGSRGNNPYYPSYPPTSRKNNTTTIIIFLMVFLFILVIGAVGGYYIWKNYFSEESKSTTPAPT